MTGQSARGKVPWTDKFKTPCLDDLRGSMPNKQVLQLMDDARRMFLDRPGVVETIAWQGVPWRWTLVFGTPQDGARALGYVVPDPGRLQVCLPLTAEMVTSLPFRRLKKAIRDGIIFARSAAGVHWPCWEITSAGTLSDIQELVERKLKFLNARESVGSPG
jgi:hypothetical protein